MHLSYLVDTRVEVVSRLARLVGSAEVDMVVVVVTSELGFSEVAGLLFSSVQFSPDLLPCPIYDVLAVANFFLIIHGFYNT